MNFQKHKLKYFLEIYERSGKTFSVEPKQTIFLEPNPYIVHLLFYRNKLHITDFICLTGLQTESIKSCNYSV